MYGGTNDRNGYNILCRCSLVAFAVQQIFFGNATQRVDNVVQKQEEEAHVTKMAENNIFATKPHLMPVKDESKR